MKRLQVMIEEDLDAALEREARSEGTSKAALIRRFVRDHLKPLPPANADPIWQMAGVDDFEPEPVDDVVYR
ncbi:MAG TPA: CopG family transcriptional regulator [Thermoanaerobaculia bacterium]|nr:CopG family transcriptional regulator [Thermoanaerobaculia bacterium]